MLGISFLRLCPLVLLPRPLLYHFFILQVQVSPPDGPVPLPGALQDVQAAEGIDELVWMVLQWWNNSWGCRGAWCYSVVSADFPWLGPPSFSSKRWLAVVYLGSDVPDLRI